MAKVVYCYKTDTFCSDYFPSLKLLYKDIDLLNTDLTKSIDTLGIFCVLKHGDDYTILDNISEVDSDYMSDLEDPDCIYDTTINFDYHHIKFKKTYNNKLVSIKKYERITRDDNKYQQKIYFPKNKEYEKCLGVLWTYKEYDTDGDLIFVNVHCERHFDNIIYVDHGENASICFIIKKKCYNKKIIIDRFKISKVIKIINSYIDEYDNSKIFDKIDEIISKI